MLQSMNSMEHSPLERDSSSYWGFRGIGWLSKGGQVEGEAARVDNGEHIYNCKQKGGLCTASWRGE